MNGSDIFVGFIVLVIVIVVFFVTRRSSATKSKPLIQQTESKEWVDMLDRLAVGSGHANLAPGTTVPVSGYYECLLCGKGGLTDKMARSLYGEAEARRRLANLKPSMRYFNQNELFPQCPNCGESAGWSLLK